MDSTHVNKNLQKARQFMALKKHPEALNLYGGLVKHFPQGGGEYGRAAADAGDFSLAFQVWEKFRGQQPGKAGLLARLADEYQTIGLHAQARELLAQAALIEPRALDLQLKLASLLARTNSIDEARAAVDKCVALDSRQPQALFLLARLDRCAGKIAEAEKQLRDLIASAPRDPAVNYSCHAELAHILDRSGRSEEAMSLLIQGKRLARQAFGLEAERKAFYERHENEARKAVSLPKDILVNWAKSFPPRARNVVSPVAFLSGCARSGTTLLERILDAHPGVAAFDESPAFKGILPHIDLSSAQRLNILRQNYLRNLVVGASTLAPNKLLLDKNPSRTIWLPAFLRLFPELRVLIALRDPRDVMVSLYFQDHARTNYLTLDELAQHYQGVMQVWLAVRQWEGLTWMETRYEDVVADLPKEGARVTKFLGLDWRQDQAHFYKSNREKPVMSTNYHDVSQPVYQRAVGRWQVYEKYLAPILPALQPYCQTFGYA